MSNDFNPMFGLDDVEEDDEDEYTIGETLLVCEQLENGKPCANDGKCVVFNHKTGEMQVCEHLSIEDRESFEANN